MPGTSLASIAYRQPAAGLGPKNPLPMFRGDTDHGTPPPVGALPEEDARYMGWSTAWRALPHRMQDTYDRGRTVTDLAALRLENEILSATFLPGMGGKLASLVHRPTGRELLTRNPVFQPANLALRNAWCSGGIEWNAGGPPGHHHLTCAPLFAARIVGEQGEPALRFYEWDRVKGFVWQIDFHLPPGSPVLYAHTRVTNPNDHEIAMYWWTNIAVDEADDVRVLVPAETATLHDYKSQLAARELPAPDGRDLTYATRSPHAADFFSRIPDGRRRWEAALDGRGTGLFEVSTDRLRGRKLFCWGMGQGGRRWQEFLAEPGVAYIEIQAGLARTQMECVPMPANTRWDWTEAFGLLQADPALVHGVDWAAAWGEAAQCIERIVPTEAMETRHAAFAALAEQPPAAMIQAGSGWGALERMRIERSGGGWPIGTATPFGPDSLSADQAPWVTLLTDGYLPEGEPDALMTQPEWLPLLEAGLRRAPNNWLAWWHAGNLRMEARDVAGACEAWRRSLQCRRTGWARRNLAVAAQRNGDQQEAIRLLREAWEAGPAIPALAVELLGALNDSALWDQSVDYVASLPDAVRNHERVLILWARAALAADRLEGVDALFTREFAGIREGEVSLTDLWFTWHERRMAAAAGVEVDDALRAQVRAECPPPRAIDFRMS